MSLDKREIHLEGTRGKTASVSIAAENNSDAGIEVKAYFEDFEFIEPFDGRKQPFPLGTTAHSCGDWMTVLPSQFSLPPRKSQIVNCLVNVPRDAQGSYYGVLFFEKLEASPSRGVGIIVRIGCPFFIQIKGSQVQAEINGQSGKVDTIAIDVRNTGNTLLMYSGTFAVMDDANMSIERGKIEGSSIPSGKNKVTEIQLSKVPAGLKKYILVVTLHVEGSSNIVKEIIFTKDHTGTVKIVDDK